MVMKAPSVDPRPNAPPRNFPDKTGHVCFNNEQSRAFMHCIEKDAAINGMRKCGMLTYKPSRNPLRAEATPRVDNKNFVFDVPPAEPKTERWKYPETDWGLMLKFASQKKIYQELDETAKRCENKIREFREKQKELAAQDEAAKSGRLTNRDDRSGRDSGRLTGRTARMDYGQSSLTESGLLDEEPKSAVPSARNKYDPNAHHSWEYDPAKDFNPTEVGKAEINKLASGVQTLKYLRTHNKHPEMLDKYRAERAAKFVKTQGHHATDPPTHRSLPPSQFKPGGGQVDLDLTREERYRRERALLEEMKNRKAARSMVQQEEVIDTGRMKEQLTGLMEQLNKTNSELARQELKIALNHKTKNYEKPRSTHK